MKIKSIFKAVINNYAEIGSPWRVLFSKLKYCVVFPPFMNTRFLFFGYGLNPPDKCFPETLFFKELN